jgi:hypothetical protein
MKDTTYLTMTTVFITVLFLNSGHPSLKDAQMGTT